jgi:hypothetical protein
VPGAAGGGGYRKEIRAGVCRLEWERDPRVKASTQARAARLKAAKAVGLKVPPRLLARANICCGVCVRKCPILLQK